MQYQNREFLGRNNDHKLLAFISCYVSFSYRQEFDYTKSVVARWLYWKYIFVKIYNFCVIQNFRYVEFEFVVVLNW